LAGLDSKHTLGAYLDENLNKQQNSMEDAAELMEYCIDEDIITLHDNPADPTDTFALKQAHLPSLRYLLAHITRRCNLACKHCYLGEGQAQDMTPADFQSLVEQFEKMQGLKLMISGGEPLLHPEIKTILEIAASRRLRVVLLSNATLIDEKMAQMLSGYIHEVQVSIDGTEQSHDRIRGTGSFNKAMEGIRNLQKAGIGVSIATMIHKYNAHEFDEMKAILSELGVISWTLDVPCIEGNLKLNNDMILDIKTAACIFSSYGFGGGAHGSSGSYTYGSHLAATMPDGDFVHCGFFENHPTGSIQKGLEESWKTMTKQCLWDVEELICHSCPVIMDCHGGCRARAKDFGDVLGPDHLMCYANSIDPKTYASCEKCD
ncbi:MAG: radical SAM protein, partial [Methanosarcinales archaeon]|nr:radical SAM protein [Methanosarcinales archaeon]